MNNEAMALLVPGSAVQTIDRLNLFLFYGYRIEPEQQRRLLSLCRELHESPQAWRGLFAHAPGESRGMRFFTGEACRVDGRDQLSHELAACLKKMKPPGAEPLLRDIDRALARMLAEGSALRTDSPESQLALWRHLSAAPFRGRERILRAGVERLRRDRSGNGRWTGWPFYYTLLVLLEMPPGIARGELLHAVPSCRRAIPKLRSGPRAKRRRDLLMRVLAQYGEGDISA